MVGPSAGDSCNFHKTRSCNLKQLLTSRAAVLSCAWTLTVRVTEAFGRPLEQHDEGAIEKLIILAIHSLFDIPQGRPSDHISCIGRLESQ